MFWNAHIFSCFSWLWPAGIPHSPTHEKENNNHHHMLISIPCCPQCWARQQFACSYSLHPFYFCFKYVATDSFCKTKRKKHPLQKPKDHNCSWPQPSRPGKRSLTSIVVTLSVNLVRRSWIRQTTSMTKWAAVSYSIRSLQEKSRVDDQVITQKQANQGHVLATAYAIWDKFKVVKVILNCSVWHTQRLIVTIASNWVMTVSLVIVLQDNFCYNIHLLNNKQKQNYYWHTHSKNYMINKI